MCKEGLQHPGVKFCAYVCERRRLLSVAPMHTCAVVMVMHKLQGLCRCFCAHVGVSACACAQALKILFMVCTVDA